MTALGKFFHVANVNRLVLLAILLLVGHLELEYWRNKGNTTPAEITDTSTAMKIIIENDKAMGNEINRIAEEVTKQGDKISKQRDMITLIGACNNENFMANKNNDNNYLFINSNWTVPRFPNYIQLNEDDRKWFGKFVQEGTGGTGSSADITKSYLGAPMPNRD